MTDVSFEFEDPVRKWKREADERTAAEQEAREERARAERRARREMSRSWEEYIAAEIGREHELMIDVVGQAIGEEIADLRKELQSEMRTSSVLRSWSRVDCARMSGARGKQTKTIRRLIFACTMARPGSQSIRTRSAAR